MNAPELLAAIGCVAFLVGVLVWASWPFWGSLSQSRFPDSPPAPAWEYKTETTVTETYAPVEPMDTAALIQAMKVNLKVPTPADARIISNGRLLQLKRGEKK